MFSEYEWSVINIQIAYGNFFASSRMHLKMVLDKEKLKILYEFVIMLWNELLNITKST